VLQAEKDHNKPKHSDDLDVPNLQVIKLMQSFTSQELVTERFAWRHYYWCAALGLQRYLGRWLVRRRVLQAGSAIEVRLRGLTPSSIVCWACVKRDLSELEAEIAGYTT
jgi:hypothetical protein